MYLRCSPRRSEPRLWCFPRFPPRRAAKGTCSAPSGPWEYSLNVLPRIESQNSFLLASVTTLKVALLRSRSFLGGLWMLSLLLGVAVPHRSQSPFHQRHRLVLGMVQQGVHFILINNIINYSDLWGGWLVLAGPWSILFKPLFAWSVHSCMDARYHFRDDTQATGDPQGSPCAWCTLLTPLSLIPREPWFRVLPHHSTAWLNWFLYLQYEWNIESSRRLNARVPHRHRRERERSSILFTQHDQRPSTVRNRSGFSLSQGLEERNIPGSKRHQRHHPSHRAFDVQPYSVGAPPLAHNDGDERRGQISLPRRSNLVRQPVWTSYGGLCWMIHGGSEVVSGDATLPP